MRPGKVKTLMKTFYCFCFAGKGESTFPFYFLIFGWGVALLVFFQSQLKLRRLLEALDMAPILSRLPECTH